MLLQPVRTPTASTTGAPTADVTVVLTQLRDAMTASLERVIDMFRRWDADESGRISRREFHQAAAALGVRASRAVVDAAFSFLDVDVGSLAPVTLTCP